MNWLNTFRSSGIEFDTFDVEHVSEVFDHSPLFGEFSDHGIGHWSRVLSFANHLAEQEALDDSPIPTRDALYLASLFHDSMRVSEMSDHGHGGRGAMNLLNLSKGRWFSYYDEQAIELAMHCCCLHTEFLPKDFQPQSNYTGHLACILNSYKKEDAEVMIKTIEIFCDADRLDLPRIGMNVNPEYLFTDSAKSIAASMLQQQQQQQSNATTRTRTIPRD